MSMDLFKFCDTTDEASTQFIFPGGQMPFVLSSQSESSRSGQIQIDIEPTLLRMRVPARYGYSAPGVTVQTFARGQGPPKHIRSAHWQAR